MMGVVENSIVAFIRTSSTTSIIIGCFAAAADDDARLPRLLGLLLLLLLALGILFLVETADGVISGAVDINVDVDDNTAVDNGYCRCCGGTALLLV
jgi:hypothetical protein